MKNSNEPLSDEEFFDMFADAMGKALEERLRFRSPNRMQQHKQPKPRTYH